MPCPARHAESCGPGAGNADVASGGGGEDGGAAGLAQAAEGGGRDGEGGVRHGSVGVPQRAQGGDQGLKVEMNRGKLRENAISVDHATRKMIIF